MPKQRLYEQYGVKPDPKVCLECDQHEEVTGLEYGNCKLASMSAYYAQLDGLCEKIAERLGKTEMPVRRRGKRKDHA